MSLSKKLFMAGALVLGMGIVLHLITVPFEDWSLSEPWRWLSNTSYHDSVFTAFFIGAIACLVIGLINLGGKNAK
ncbi:hypothetical protein [Candidatus Avelusimicrobium stercoris]|uniref:hypothetical protein n=1 Tax=Candidatus Avelusimicrobium stercoris TaxID=1947924 RepID=UPI003D0EA899